MKYEYKVDIFNGADIMRSGGTKEKQYLDDMGQQGWELVNVYLTSLSFGSDSYYWKRQIIDK